MLVYCLALAERHVLKDNFRHSYEHSLCTPLHCSCRRLYVLHAHTYFQYTTDAEKAKAQEFYAAIQAEFTGNSGVRVGPIVEKATAVHLTPQFETSFTKSNLVHVLPWFMFNRPEGFSILVHPFTEQLVSYPKQLLAMDACCL